MLESIRTVYALITITIVVFLAVTAELVYKQPHDLKSYGLLIFIVPCVAMLFVVRVVYRLPDRQKARLVGEANESFGSHTRRHEGME